MTTQELRSYIDRILGNSLRVLLPSYWWKRVFGATLDVVEDVKNTTKTLQKEVDKKATLSETIVLDWSTTELTNLIEGAIYSIPKDSYGNIAETLTINDDLWSGKERVGAADDVAVTVWFKGKTKLSVKKWNEEVTNWVRTPQNLNLSNLDKDKLYRYQRLNVWTSDNSLIPVYTITEYSDGQSWYDSVLSETSTNAVQNKVVTEAIQELQNRPESGGILITDETTAMEYLHAMIDAPKMYANIAGYILYEEHDDSGNVVRYSLGVVDSVDINENTNTASLEYSIHGKRYRNIYSSGTFVETVELPSSSVLPIYLCIDDGVGIMSPPDMEREANKMAYNALQHLGSSALPYCIITLYKDGAKVGELSIGIGHYSTGTNLDFYTVDWDNGNKFDLLKYRLHEDGSVTPEGRIQADSEMSDTSTNPVQNKVIKEYVNNAVASAITNTLNTEV